MADSSPIAIVGAGASGLIAAIAAAGARPRVMLLEKEARVGRKLLATGNGRCNLLNTHVKSDAYHGSGSAAALSLLSKMPPDWLLSYFSSLGLLCREESGGRCYPFSGQAASVLDVLRLSLDRLHVDVRVDAAVSEIRREKDGFALLFASGGVVCARRVVFAAGGAAAPSFGADGSAFGMVTTLGHTLVPLRPSLSPIKVPSEKIRGLKGIRAHGMVSLLVDGKTVQTETGEILFTEYGLSGIAVMQLARSAGDALRKRRVSLCLCFLERQTALLEMKKRIALLSREPMESLFVGLLPKRIGLCLLREAGISPTDAITADAVAPVFNLLHEWVLPVTGILPFQNAQTTAGGLLFDEFDPDTLESRLVPGLYACGEALDVDGDCGGYNLMWAWASGITAGKSAAL